VPKALAAAYVTGLADKKAPVRRIWVLRAGEVLHNFSMDVQGSFSSSFVKFAETIMSPLVTIFAEVVANPVAASQTGTVTGALVLCGVGSLLQRSEVASLQALAKKASIQKNSLALEPKPSYLLNQRIYSKFAEDDLRWLSRALSAISPALSSTSAPVRTAWAQAFIYLICSAATTPAVRREATDALADLYAQSVANSSDSSSIITEAITDGLWHWVVVAESGDKESAAVLSKTANSNLHLVLRSICLSPKEFAKRAGADLKKAQLEAQMCSLLVLAKPQLIPRASWIELCLKVELDPGALAREYEHRLIDEIVSRTGFEQKVGSPSFSPLSCANQSPSRPRSRLPHMLELRSSCLLPLRS